MKVKTVVILITLLASIVFPCTCNISSSGKVTSFFSHRICFTSSPALSLRADMTFIDVSSHKFIVPASKITYEILTPVFKSCLFAFQKERPPKI